MSPITVLIVEDEVIVAESISLKIARLGYTTAGFATDGQTAIDLGLSLEPSLILMDISLEGEIDGIEAAEAIRSRRDIPIIFLTAHSDDASLARAKLTSPSGYIIKPFETQDLAIQIDIALYKHKAQASLRESESRYRNLFSYSPDAIFVNLDDRVTMVNKACVKLFGTDCEEDLIGLSPYRFFRKENQSLMRQRLQRVREMGEPVERIEEQIIRLDGELIDVEIVASPFRLGERTAIHLILRDITESKRAERTLRESEQRYRRLFVNMSEGFFLAEIICDDSGRPIDFRYLDVNPALAQILKFKPSEIIGKTRNQLFQTPISWLERVWSVALNAQRDNFDIFSADLGRHMAIRAFSPRPGQFACLVSDITERIEVQENLRQMNEMLETMVTERTKQLEQRASQLARLANELILVEQRERQQLAKIVHDQIQQYIVAARMQADWLLKKDDRPPEKIQSAIQRIYNALSEALLESRALTVELSPPVLHKAGLAGSLKWLATRMLEQHQFNVQVQVRPDVGELSEETNILLFECVRELLLNVVKHAKVQEAEVRLTRFSENVLALEVVDEGAGFEPADLDKQPEKTSFGLFSIKERLVYFGGWMEIESAADSGTTVKLMVPIDQVQKPLEIPAPRPGGRTGENEKSASLNDRCHLLIVDDHLIMREGMVKLFEDADNIEVVGEAADGPQAIELVERLKPDVVLMDVNLGEMDGIEATRRIRAIDPGIRVIGLSMHLDEAVARAMYEAGAVAYLSKGAPAADVLATIRACFGKSH